MSDYTEKHKIKPWQREAAQEEINRLIANPPLPRQERAVERNEKEMEQQRAIGKEALDKLYALVSRQTGLTYEQIKEAEQHISHAAPVIPETKPYIDHARIRAKRANMPENYRKHVIEKEPIDCVPLRAVKGMLGGGERLLMLAGGRGTYKTGSACWALAQMDGGRYVDAIELVDVHLSQPERFAELLSAPLVVLDDLGREDQREGQRALFLTAWRKLVVNAYSRERRLIVTSNITWELFKRDEEDGGYGTLAADRWVEAGKWVKVPGGSNRPAMRDAHWTNREPGADDE